MEIVDIDKEQYTLNSHKSCQFMYGRAIDAFFADDDCKPEKQEVISDIAILIDACNRLDSQKTWKGFPSEYNLDEMENEDIKDLGTISIYLLNKYKTLRKMLGVNTVFSVDENKFKPQDYVWYIFHGNICVKCKIKCLGYCGLYYDLDEPVGHNVADYELFATKEELLKYLAVARFKAQKEQTLDELRNIIINEKKKNHNSTTKEELDTYSPELKEVYLKYDKEIEEWGLNSYKHKERYEEWFTITDFIDGKIKDKII